MWNANNIELGEILETRRAIKRPVSVSVKFAINPGSIDTREGRVRYACGDALLTGIEGEVWPVPKAKFIKTYEAISPTHIGEDGAYRKLSLEVLALKVSEPFTVNVSWSNDPLRGNPGDWLLQYDRGDHGIVAASIFEKTYDLIN